MQTAAKAVHWLFMAVAILVVVSGFGITYYRVVGPLTFGLMGKALSFALHDALVWPFVVLFLLHIYFTVFRKRLTKGSANNGEK